MNNKLISVMLSCVLVFTGCSSVNGNSEEQNTTAYPQSVPSSSEILLDASSMTEVPASMSAMSNYTVSLDTVTGDDGSSTKVLNFALATGASDAGYNSCTITFDSAVNMLGRTLYVVMKGADTLNTSAASGNYPSKYNDIKFCVNSDAAHGSETGTIYPLTADSYAVYSKELSGFVTQYSSDSSITSAELQSVTSLTINLQQASYNFQIASIYLNTLTDYTMSTIDISGAPAASDAPSYFDQNCSNVKYGSIETKTYNSTTTGTDRKCNVLTPNGYDASDSATKYPVIYLLHGIGGTHTEWLDGNPVLVSGNAVAAGGTKCIIVMPNCRAMDPDSCPSDPYSAEAVAAFDNFINDLFTDLMPFIEKNYNVGTGQNNTAIAGLSMGGREALYIGFTKPESFCAVGAFSAAPGLTDQISSDTMKFSDDITRPKLLLLCQGTSDSIGQCPAYDGYLNTNGVSHYYYTMPGGHDFTVWKNGLFNFCLRAFR